MAGPRIRVAALALLRDGAAGEEVLLVRKRGTERFMRPGGKFEPDEGDRDCLARELAEELSLALDFAETDHLGRFEAQAANEAGHRVDAMVYAWKPGAAPEPRAGAEIVEIRWVASKDTSLSDGMALAPLVADHVLPELGRRSR